MSKITPFHAKYYANELVLQKSSSEDSRLSSSLFNSSLIINPHQIDAALFAFKSLSSSPFVRPFLLSVIPNHLRSPSILST